MKEGVPLDISYRGIRLAPYVEDAREHIRILGRTLEIDPRVVHLLLVKIKG